MSSFYHGSDKESKDSSSDNEESDIDEKSELTENLPSDSSSESEEESGDLLSDNDKSITENLPSDSSSDSEEDSGDLMSDDDKTITDREQLIRRKKAPLEQRQKKWADTFSNASQMREFVVRELISNATDAILRLDKACQTENHECSSSTETNMPIFDKTG
eukprot:335145-Ditylum_brightwellii.AAC.1